VAPDQPLTDALAGFLGLSPSACRVWNVTECCGESGESDLLLR